MNARPRFLAMRPAMTAPVFLAAAVVLSACSNTGNVLEPTALLSPSPADPLPQAQFPPPSADGAAAGSQQVAAISTDAKVQFAPVIGATAEASQPLAARLAARASARGISLVGAGDASATHVMKGYFSAISDNGETTVIYVWDVVDGAGNRIHRIQGQAKSPSNTGGWADVGPQTMEAIADQTVDQLAAWLVSGQG
ncbi:hypothetical protein [Mesorhizobium sp. CAU 1741]|uniref:hypothetical protein n=1 Tax=Mesorhizobium sp. CAU 1741 TaxID=3140366 RepID=UPI00325B04D8